MAKEINVDDGGISFLNMDGKTHLRIWAEDFDRVRKAMENSEVLKKDLETAKVKANKLD